MFPGSWTAATRRARPGDFDLVPEAIALEKRWLDAITEMQDRQDRFFIAELKQRIELACNFRDPVSRPAEPLPRTTADRAVESEAIAPVRERIKFEMSLLDSSPLSEVLMNVAGYPTTLYHRFSRALRLEAEYGFAFQGANGRSRGLPPIEALNSMVAGLLHDISRKRADTRARTLRLKKRLQVRQRAWQSSRPTGRRLQIGCDNGLALENGDRKLFISFEITPLPVGTAWPSPAAIWEALGSMPGALADRLHRIDLTTESAMGRYRRPTDCLSPEPCSWNSGLWASAWSAADKTLLLLPWPTDRANDAWSVRSTLMSQAAKHLARSIATDPVRWTYWLNRLQSVDPAACVAAAAGCSTPALYKLAATLSLYHDLDIDLRNTTEHQRAALHSRYAFLDTWI